MRRIVLPMMVLSLTAAPAALEAQTREAPRDVRVHAPLTARAGALIDPAARVLAQRAELGLTSDQVYQLQAIQSRFEAQNRPLLDQLKAARAEHGALPGGGRGVAVRRPAAELTPGQRAEIRGRMQRRAGDMRARAEQASERAAELTPEQRAELRERSQQRAGEARAHMEALRPVLQQLQANRAQARQEVAAVLTAEQRSTLRELQQARAAEARARAGGETGALRRGPVSRR